MGRLYSPTVFKHATEKSPIDINTIILLEFVLRSRHITNVAMIISVPTIDNEAAVVDKILFRVASAVCDCGTVVADSNCSKLFHTTDSMLEFSTLNLRFKRARDSHKSHVRATLPIVAKLSVCKLQNRLLFRSSATGHNVCNVKKGFVKRSYKCVQKGI